MPDGHVHDVIIIGAGPAGFAAALYTTRDGYDTLILEKAGIPGGQILLTERIENYPGYEKITGPDLIAHMQRQVENPLSKMILMGEFKEGDRVRVDVGPDGFTFTT